MSILAIDEHRIAGAPAIRLSGRLDYDTSPALRQVLLKYVDREGLGLIADLDGVEYMDTTGLATLLEALSRLRRHGGRMVLFGLGPRVLDLFAMNEVDRLFTIVEDEDAAAKLME
jgi:anti-sigma B factor antagonist